MDELDEDPSNDLDWYCMNSMLEESAMVPTIGKYFEPSGYKGKDAYKGVLKIFNKELQKTLLVYEAIYANMRLSRREIYTILCGYFDEQPVKPFYYKESSLACIYPRAFWSGWADNQLQDMRLNAYKWAMKNAQISSDLEQTIMKIG